MLTICITDNHWW